MQQWNRTLVRPPASTNSDSLFSCATLWKSLRREITFIILRVLALMKLCLFNKILQIIVIRMYKVWCCGNLYVWVISVVYAETFQRLSLNSENSQHLLYFHVILQKYCLPHFLCFRFANWNLFSPRHQEQQGKSFSKQSEIKCFLILIF